MKTPSGTHLAISALALAGVLRTPGLSFTGGESEIRVEYADLAPAVTTSVSATEEVEAPFIDEDDVMQRDVPAAEMLAWGRSMMGGDTSEMLDI